MDRLLKALDERILFPLRFSFLSRRLAPLLAGHRTVLDVGCSCGRLARRLQTLTGAEFQGVDIHLQPTTAIPAQPYDGNTLPFPDASFDCVIMVDMLHHTHAQARLLEEARRVARRTVLIKDHFWTRPLDVKLLRIADYIGNKPYGVDLPFTYLTIPEWEQLIAASGLRIVRSARFRYVFADICKHVVFELESGR